MWLKEISNAEIRKNRLCGDMGCDRCCGYEKLGNPEKINPLLEALIDPINDKVTNNIMLNYDHLDQKKIRLFKSGDNKITGCSDGKCQIFDIESGEPETSVIKPKSKCCGF